MEDFANLTQAERDRCIYEAICSLAVAVAGGDPNGLDCDSPVYSHICNLEDLQIALAKGLAPAGCTPEGVPVFLCAITDDEGTTFSTVLADGTPYSGPVEQCEQESITIDNTCDNPIPVIQCTDRVEYDVEYICNEATGVFDQHLVVITNGVPAAPVITPTTTACASAQPDFEPVRVCNADGFIHIVTYEYDEDGNQSVLSDIATTEECPPQAKAISEYCRRIDTIEVDNHTSGEPRPIGPGAVPNPNDDATWTITTSDGVVHSYAYPGWDGTATSVTYDGVTYDTPNRWAWINTHLSIALATVTGKPVKTNPALPGTRAYGVRGPDGDTGTAWGAFGWIDCCPGDVIPVLWRTEAIEENARQGRIIYLPISPVVGEVEHFTRCLSCDGTSEWRDEDGNLLAERPEGCLYKDCNIPSGTAVEETPPCSLQTLGPLCEFDDDNNVITTGIFLDIEDCEGVRTFVWYTLDDTAPAGEEQVDFVGVTANVRNCDGSDLDIPDEPLPPIGESCDNPIYIDDCKDDPSLVPCGPETGFLWQSGRPNTTVPRAIRNADTGEILFEGSDFGDFISAGEAAGYTEWSNAEQHYFCPCPDGNWELVIDGVVAGPVTCQSLSDLPGAPEKPLALLATLCEGDDILEALGKICDYEGECLEGGEPTGQVWTLFSKFPNPHPDAATYPGIVHIGELGPGSNDPDQGLDLNNWNVFSICAEAQPVDDSNGHFWRLGAPSTFTWANYSAGPASDPECEPSGGLLRKFLYVGWTQCMKDWFTGLLPSREVCEEDSGGSSGDCDCELSSSNYDPDNGNRWDAISVSGGVATITAGPNGNGSFGNHMAGTNPQCTGDLWLGRYGAYDGPPGGGANLLAAGYILASRDNVSGSTYTLGAPGLGVCAAAPIEAALVSAGFTAAEAASLLANGHAGVDVLATPGATHINGVFDPGAPTPFGVCVTLGTENCDNDSDGGEGSRFAWLVKICGFDRLTSAIETNTEAIASQVHVTSVITCDAEGNQVIHETRHDYQGVLISDTTRPLPETLANPCPCDCENENPCVFVNDCDQFDSKQVFKDFAHKGGSLSESTVQNASIEAYDCNGAEAANFNLTLPVEDVANNVNTNVESAINAQLGQYGFSAVPETYNDPINLSDMPGFMRLTYPTCSPWTIVLRNVPFGIGNPTEYQHIRYRFDGTDLNVELLDASDNVVGYTLGAGNIPSDANGDPILCLP